ncbi:uncharacterized protein BDW43DRAFT_255974 [Aspergillus alliaceus]|uniref:uncharacterized protein n=1 Tax=Petromyces alliaceus TaxID=209559 RepID=UPI0012A64A16|nr:uncharacterized protein BDW43DRAFT_255974 [Aspergillus alliaceus]KAB8227258.1 hypothetical protein BDW43DRAFT_255974 [Aspergillus alliaceus]
MFRSAFHNGYHTGKKWSKYGCETLVHDIKRRYPDVKTWPGFDQREFEKAVQEGRNYDAWAKCLGGDGFLAALPQSVPEGTQNRGTIERNAHLLLRLGIKEIVTKYHLIDVGSFVSKTLEEKLITTPYQNIYNLITTHDNICNITAPGNSTGNTNKRTRFAIEKPRKKLKNTTGTASTNHNCLAIATDSNTELEGVSVPGSQHTTSENDGNNPTWTTQQPDNLLPRATQSGNISKDSSLSTALVSHNPRLPDYQLSLLPNTQSAESSSTQIDDNSNNEFTTTSPAGRQQLVEYFNCHQQSSDSLKLPDYESRGHINEAHPSSQIAVRTSTADAPTDSSSNTTHHWGTGRNLRINAPPDFGSKHQAGLNTWPTELSRPASETMWQPSPLVNTGETGSDGFQMNCQVSHQLQLSASSAFAPAERAQDCTMPSCNQQPQSKTSVPESFYGGNWDQNYIPELSALGSQNPTRAESLFFGNWDRDYDTRSQRTRSETLLNLGNWDKNYNPDLSCFGSQNPTPAGSLPFGNWDKDYDARLQETGETLLNLGNWDQNYNPILHMTVPISH